ncbi:1,4-alpha-glucan branching protein GlgB [Pseudoroseomonas ludipueritiae]|uniref:1,4-alpha-glucan branching enzyme GlgB n=1 Tax=Pseudoroseomonas ludipueritiae TaxID=198093 RepID=A0ABR7R9E7_9PROT|nr:1,4-alpha-glucan branching protein GlgB [Pseudoroseomonas ludipueritiae]MBC9178296.1 1,4-alpha-glucan branching protein GlgB [Pseudoroseomonas ludipueritiae]MCG7361030.1 1,4-alpha-glucan branching protein GlgB [Roseomonas sp. ACRSG]
MADLDLDPGALAALVEARHGDPFAVLGPHDVAGGRELRVLVPGAMGVQAVSGGEVSTLRPVHQAGLYAGRIPPGPYLLRIDWGNGEVQETEDPYSFGLLISDFDLYLLSEGTHQDIATCLGAQPMEIDGIKGVRFAVWAPNARRVSVVGDFNSWDGRRNPMRKRVEGGIWELFIPRLTPGAVYKYELLGPEGNLLPLKSDPFAWQVEAPPATASVVADIAAIPKAPHRERPANQAAEPISVYEVHASSWARADGDMALGWEELGDKLIPYAVEMGFTHLEFLPIMAHPFGGSWGYQPLGQFAPHAPFGPPEHFARMVQRCHEAGLGVILDWVPAHFPSDQHGLAMFDGTPLYEHSDPKEGYHRDWNTLIYNLGRREVRNLLIGSALHWLERYGVDGLRVDAVASMLYRDYSRNEGEWVPNIYGGRENLESIAFLQELSRVIQQRCPDRLLIAEESTAFPGVTRKPDDNGGLGFDFKWNMGWMHDTLHYMQTDPLYRRHHHGEMTFGLVYAFSEKFMLPLSHDEVVHGKGSLIGKMPGDEWQRFANLRAYLSFMWTHPGKKLLFMGGEIAQEREWNHDRSLDWHLLDDPRHAGVQRLVRDLNRLYRGTPALHQRDCVPEGFAWSVIDDAANSVFAYLRFGEDGEKPVLVVCNFTPIPHQGYTVGVPMAGAWQEAFNSDAAIYGGSNMGNGGVVQATEEPSHGQPASLSLTVPPLATIILTPP